MAPFKFQAGWLTAALRSLVCHGLAWIVLVCAAALAAIPEGSESPTEAVRGTVDHVIRILEDPALKDTAKRMPRRRLASTALLHSDSLTGQIQTGQLHRLILHEGRLS